MKPQNDKYLNLELKRTKPLLKHFSFHSASGLIKHSLSFQKTCVLSTKIQSVKQRNNSNI